MAGATSPRIMGICTITGSSRHMVPVSVPLHPRVFRHTREATSQVRQTGSFKADDAFCWAATCDDQDRRTWPTQADPAGLAWHVPCCLRDRLGDQFRADAEWCRPLPGMGHPSKHGANMRPCVA